MAAANVVEILVTAKNESTPGMTEAAASTREVTAATKDLAAAEQAEADAKAALEEKTAALADVQEREGATAKEVADAEAAVAGAQEKATAASDQAAAAADRVSIAQARQADAAKTVADAQASAAARTTAAATESAGAATAAGDAAVASGTKAEEAGGLMAGMGGKLKMAGLGIAVGMGLAVDQASKFQDATTHLVTDAGESAAKLGMVQQGILAVSAATGTSASQITDAMYHIESGGFHGAQGLAILKTTAEGAKVGGADLDTTSKALIGTLTAYYGTSMTAAQATQRSTSLMNQLIATVGSGDMRMQDLAASIHSVAPIAAAAGISFAQVGGAIATMTAQGMSADQVTQDLGHVIGSLSNPTNVMAVEMKAMGLNANSVAKNLGRVGLSGTIDELRDAVLRNTQGGNVMLNMLRGMSPAAQDLANKILAGKISTGDLTKAMKELNPQQETLVSHFKSAATSVTGMQQTYTAAMSKMLGGQMGLNVGLMLTGKHMNDVATATRNITAEGAKASGTVDNWSTIQGTFAFKMDQAKASIKDTGIALGSALLPAVSAILGPLAHFLAVIASNKAAAIAFAIVVGGVLAGAIGVKAVKALTEMKSAMETTIGGIEKLIGKIAGIGAAQDAAAAETTAAAATQEADAAEVAAANETAAAESEGSWLSSAASMTLSAAKWAGQAALSAAKAAAGYAAAAAGTVASWAVSGAKMIAQAAVWVAGTVAKVAVVVAANVAGALATAAAWVVANGVMLLGIGLVIAAVVIAVVEIVKHWKAISKGIAEAWHDVYSFILKIVSDIVNWVKSHWVLLVGILTGPIGLAVALVITHFAQLRAGAERVVGDVESFFRSLPSRILHALGDLASLLFGSGQRVIQGLINGVTSMISSIGSAMGGVVDEIKSFLPFSPAKKGPLSGAGAPSNSGRSIARQLAEGLTAGTGEVSGAMQRLAGSAAARAGSAVPGGAYGAQGGAGAQVTVMIQPTPGGSGLDQLFGTWLRNWVRAQGGDPNMFTRKVAYAG